MTHEAQSVTIARLQAEVEQYKAALAYMVFTAGGKVTIPQNDYESYNPREVVLTSTVNSANSEWTLTTSVIVSPDSTS
jgi:hypothetical protein